VKSFLINDPRDKHKKALVAAHSILMEYHDLATPDFCPGYIAIDGMTHLLFYLRSLLGNFASAET
jgi:hypothetical protein